MKTSSNVYLYAILNVAHGDKINTPLVGIHEQSLYVIAYQNIAAVVSNISQQTISPKRSYMAAHHAILKQLMQKNTVLPIRFGMIAKKSANVINLLKKYYNALSEQLIHMTDKIEMGVTMRWDLTNIYEYFVARYPELKKAREILLQQSHPSHLLQIEIGELFESLLQSEREQHTKKMTALLSSICEDVIHNPVSRIEEILNFSCLVKRDHKEIFEQKIMEIANHWNDDFLIKFTGPWPLHSFVQLDLEL